MDKSVNVDDSKSFQDRERPDAGLTGVEAVDADDPHKVEKLTKAGRDIDPDDGSD